MIGTTIFTDSRRGQLSYRAWLPYDYSSPTLFTITLVFQASSITLCALISICCDCLFSGLMTHTRCVLEILELRLKNIIEYRADSMKQCVRLHKHIYKFAAMVNEEFKVIMFIQFLVSMLALCSALYRFTQGKLGSRLIETVFYTSCVLIQALYYCWYGNEVKEKSLSVPEMVIDSNWTVLDNDSKKILLMIMKRATIPIEFNSFYIASMDLPTFMTTAYSAYNVLQQGQG
ncbi:putative odorant receptor 71a [Hylaeus anthracinus]|uniref:putative odorant receptor 71a n=1 Tax=Hylaeus anthracinus TaxID=313031 RepID=UPI0023B906BD|nr:putative odorant receptor 71a [Hylaeus anthracinus]